MGWAPTCPSRQAKWTCQPNEPLPSRCGWYLQLPTRTNPGYGRQLWVMFPKGRGYGPPKLGFSGCLLRLLCVSGFSISRDRVQELAFLNSIAFCFVFKVQILFFFWLVCLSVCYSCLSFQKPNFFFSYRITLFISSPPYSLPRQLYVPQIPFSSIFFQTYTLY